MFVRSSCSSSAHAPPANHPIHVFCRGGRFRGAERFSRHWYDVASIDNTAYVASALTDRDLARRVAEHKTMFFRERDGQGDVIDYDAAVMGALHLAPDGQAEELLAINLRGNGEGRVAHPPFIFYCHYQF